MMVVDYGCWLWLLIMVIDCCFYRWYWQPSWLTIWCAGQQFINWSIPCASPGISSCLASTWFVGIRMNFWPAWLWGGPQCSSAAYWSNVAIMLLMVVVNLVPKLVVNDGWWWVSGWWSGSVIVVIVAAMLSHCRQSRPVATSDQLHFRKLVFFGSIKGYQLS